MKCVSSPKSPFIMVVVGESGCGHTHVNVPCSPFSGRVNMVANVSGGALKMVVVAKVVTTQQHLLRCKLPCNWSLFCLWW